MGMRTMGSLGSKDVVVVATKGSQYEKIIGNMEEVRSRGGHVIAIATEGDKNIQKHCNDVIFVPDVPEPLQPLVTVVPLQLIAYHAAVLRGKDVDKPRNLAKSVTVEWFTTVEELITSEAINLIWKSGVIHSGIERGFIRAECYHVDDLFTLKYQPMI